MHYFTNHPFNYSNYINSSFSLISSNSISTIYSICFSFNCPNKYTNMLFISFFISSLYISPYLSFFNIS